MAALYGSSLFSVAPMTPAKTPTSKSNIPILRTPCFFLHPPSPTHCFCSSKILTNTLRATPPQKYRYPDPIPDFAEAETQKFKTELLKMLSKDKEAFEGELDTVIEVCAEIFNEFLEKEYGGPGTLLVEPFTDMLVALKERKLPGAPVAARASLLWAQNYVDQDWEVWNSKPPQ